MQVHRFARLALKCSKRHTERTTRLDLRTNLRSSGNSRDRDSQSRGGVPGMSYRAVTERGRLSIDSRRERPLEILKNPAPSARDAPFFFFSTSHDQTSRERRKTSDLSHKGRMENRVPGTAQVLTQDAFVRSLLVKLCASSGVGKIGRSPYSPREDTSGVYRRLPLPYLLSPHILVIYILQWHIKCYMRRKYIV